MNSIINSSILNDWIRGSVAVDAVECHWQKLVLNMMIKYQQRMLIDNAVSSSNDHGKQFEIGMVIHV